MIQRSILLTLIVMVILGSTWAWAAEAEVLTLEDAIRLAINQNPTLQSAHLDLEKSESDLALAWRNIFPQVKVQSSYTRLEEGIPQPTGEYNTVPVGEFPVQIGTELVNLPVVTPIPVYEEGSPNMYNTQLTVQQPVFMGGKVQLGIDMAKDNITLANIEATKALNDTVHNVILTYYNLMMVQEMLHIQQSGLELIEEHQRIAEANYEAGLMLKKDLLNIEIEKRKAVQQLKSSQNKLRLAEKQFAQLLGVTDFQYQLLTPTMELSVEADLQAQFQAALNNRGELQSLQLNQKMLGKNLTMEKRSFWPNVILLGNYTWKGDTFSLEDGSWTITANASMNLFDGGISREKRTGLQIQLQKLKQAEENLAQMIRLEVEEALLKVEETQEELEIQQLSLEYATENLDVAEKSYEVGMGTNTEVMNALLALQQAELGQVQAKYQHQLSQFKLLYKTGKLMNYLEEVIESEK